MICAALTRLSSQPGSCRVIPEFRGRTCRMCWAMPRCCGAPVGRRVAVIGAGGIGFVVAEARVHQGTSPALWRREWGVGDPATSPGGLAVSEPQPGPPAQGHAVATESGKAGAAAGQDDRVESPRQTAGQGCGDAGGCCLQPHCSRRAGGDRGCRTAPHSRRYGGALHRAGTPAGPCWGAEGGRDCASRYRGCRIGGRT